MYRSVAESYLLVKLKTTAIAGITAIAAIVAIAAHSAVMCDILSWGGIICTVEKLFWVDKVS